MLIAQSTAAEKLAVPSNLTVAQFLLDQPFHHTRPQRLSTTPCLIDDATGQRIYLDEVRRVTEIRHTTSDTLFS